MARLTKYLLTILTVLTASVFLCIGTSLANNPSQGDYGDGGTPPSTEKPVTSEGDTGGKAAEDFEEPGPSARTTIIDGSLEEPAKDAQAVVDLVVKLQNIVWAAAGAVAIAMTVWSGTLMMTAGGNEERITKGKRVLTYSIGGVILILVSYEVVTMLVTILGGRIVSP